MNASAIRSAASLINVRALYIMLGLYCFVALVYVFLGNNNRDEGWYLYASRLVYEGKVPYRDFPYFQMPLLPYIYGLPQFLFGPSILVGRLTSFAFSLITVGTGVYLAQRIAGRGAALLFLAFTIVNPNVMWTYTTTRTEPLVTPLVMLSLLFLLKQRRSTIDLVLAPSLMLWAMTVRLTVMPAFAAVLIFSLYQARKNSRQWDTILALVGLQMVVLVVVPLILTGERMVFNVWSTQEFRGSQFGTPEPPLGTLLRAKALFLPLLQAWYPLAVVLTVGLTAFLISMWRGGWRPSVAGLGEWPTAHLAMLSLVGLIFLPNLALNALQPYYFVPAFPIAALMAASALHRLSGALHPHPEWVILPSLVGTLLLIEALTFASIFPLTLNTVDPDIVAIRNVGSYLKSVVPPDKRVVTLDTSVVLEANRRVPHGLEMDVFSLWSRFTTSDARRYGVVNREILQELVADENTGAIVVGEYDEQNLWLATPPEEESVSDEQEPLIFQLLPAMRGKYDLVKEYRSFGEFRGRLRIYLRTE